MSRCTSPLALLALLFLGGCATLRPAPPPEQDAALQLARGLSALEDGQYAGAYDQLAWVATHCPVHEAGVHARSGLAALELDPRNPVGRPAIGMRLLADLILGPTTPAHLRALSEATYLLGLGLGAPAAQVPAAAEAAATQRPGDPAVVEGRAPAAPAWGTAEAMGQRRVHNCGPVLEATGPVRVALPTLPGPSLAAMLAEAEGQARGMATEAERLRGELARLRSQFEETQAELARIRRTLRP